LRDNGSTSTSTNDAHDFYDTQTWQNHGSVWITGDDETRNKFRNLTAAGAWDPLGVSYQFGANNKFILQSRVAAPRQVDPLTAALSPYVPGIKSDGYVEMVRLWDVDGVKQIAHFEARRALLSPDGKSLATTHENGTIKVWDVPPRKPVFTTVAGSLVLWLSVIVAIQLWSRLTGWWFGRKAKISSEPARAV
jgi:WD40 repeat protein